MPVEHDSGVVVAGVFSEREPDENENEEALEEEEEGLHAEDDSSQGLPWLVLSVPTPAAGEGYALRLNRTVMRGRSSKESRVRVTSSVSQNS